jgi:chromate transporter
MADSAAASVQSPGPLQLFTAFMGVGVIGFGGVLPLARRMLVEERRWLTAEEFAELLAVAQFLPGGNIMNMSIAIGWRFAGPAGAAAALSGLLIAPVTIVILLGAIYERYQHLPTVKHAFAGLAAAAAGLLIGMAVKMGLPLRAKPVSAAIAATATLLIGIVRLPLLPTMLVLVPLAVAALWISRRKLWR